MTNKELKKLKAFISSYNPSSEVLKKWFKGLVLHAKTDEEKANIEQLKDFLKINNEQS